MPSLVAINILPERLRVLKQVLDPQQYRQATYQAVKRTTNKVVTIIRQRVQQKAFISNKYMKRAIKAYQPTGDPPEGIVRVSQSLIPLIGYKARATKRGGVTVQIGPDRSLKLRHAFIATVGKGEHSGVFLRARHLPTKGPNAGRGKLTAQGFAGRFAIQEQFGPSVLGVAADPATLKDITLDTDAELVRQMDSQLNRFLGPEGAAKVLAQLPSEPE